MVAPISLDALPENPPPVTPAPTPEAAPRPASIPTTLVQAQTAVVGHMPIVHMSPPAPVHQSPTIPVRQEAPVAETTMEALIEPDVEPRLEPEFEPPPDSTSRVFVQVANDFSETSPVVRGRHAAGAQPVRTRRRSNRSMVVGAVVLVVVLATFAVVRLSSSVPAAAVTPSLSSTVSVPASSVSLPWPTLGESAIDVPSIGIDVASGPEQPVPVASLTKMMTAYIILHDHPLRVGQNGPRITITQAALNDYDSDTVNDEANAQVTLGEVVTERQLLGGMLVHSANNYADTLAMWDAGSIPAFVVKMNHTAAKLGMDHTHYADASGYDPASQSTAADLLKVATPDMADPVFAGFVKMPSITLPVAGTISTYTPLLGIQGIIGVKSGFTSVAGGCDVLAVYRTVHGHSVLIITAVTGQNGPNVLGLAGLAALNLANVTATAINATPLVHTGEVVAHVTAAGQTVNAAAQSTGEVLSWPGVTAKRTLVTTHPVRQGAPRGTRIGSVIMELGTQRVEVPLLLTANVPKESVFQRLF
jgi:serine-type D-Ala-D-Ala carboxypeptidase (penicillin-binding protein 5/6)